MALGEGSAAIDAAVATCAAQDQRGVARPQGVKCDIGAYEAEQVAPTPRRPSSLPSIDGTLGSNGWYKGNVTVSWTVNDAESAVTSVPCASTIISADTPGQAVTCSATSAGGTNSESVTIKRDATGPTIAFGSVAPLANAAGWNKANVTVTWTCDDATSGLVGSSSVTQTVMTEGQNQSATGECTDDAGNTTQDVHAGINIDKTAPALAPTVSPNPVILNGTASATPNATDARSGIATSSCGTPTTSAVGTKSVSCSATDNAGNASTAGAAYAVAYQFIGFSGRVEGGGVLNSVKAGAEHSAQVAPARRRGCAGDESDVGDGDRREPRVRRRNHRHRRRGGGRGWRLGAPEPRRRLLPAQLVDAEELCQLVQDHAAESG